MNGNNQGSTSWWLLIPAVALATVSIAQDASPDEPPPSTEASGPVDAASLLRERALATDQRSDAGPPPGYHQGSDAGTMQISVPPQGLTTTTTVTEEQSGGFQSGPIESSGNQPSPSGWPGTKASQTGWGQPGWGGGQIVTVEAGPIWNNDDARGKCPRACVGAKLVWTGDWKTVAANRSVCACAPGGGNPGYAGAGTRCSVPANYQCGGCAVQCPADRAAHCTQGDRGIFNKPDSAICPTAAKCQCL
jgi:hypothetical protein